ncbi:MAG: hypothetical protein LBC98_09385 [Prevotellaceae bacterium]|jgi:AraC-like DNA-binding protein|nr:hypothetical protein [Prevotellaceae bacterium]
MNDLKILAGYILPLASSLLCFSLMLVNYLSSRRKASSDKHMHHVMMLYYGLAIINWTNVILYVFFPTAYAKVNASFYLCLPLAQVAFYHLVYRLTDTEGQGFSFIHYAIPCLLFAVFGVWSLFVPSEIGLSLSVSRGEIQSGYKAYSVLFAHRMEVRGFYGLVYVILGARRLIRYKKTINEYSADVERNTLQWAHLLIILWATVIPFPLVLPFVAKNMMATSVIYILHGGLTMVKHSALCYNMLIGNYVVFSLEKREQEKSARLSKVAFETYIRKEKPYLNPELKITDLTLPLATNRSYLSGFINKEYSMNFNCYINSLRLKELEQLRRAHKNDDTSDTDLIYMAGFSSSHGYRRFLKTREKTD